MRRIYAIYPQNDHFPIEIFSSKAKAQEYVGNAISLFTIIEYQNLTAGQVNKLPYSIARDFEERIKTYARTI
jgi:hypothetical protein